MEGSNPLVTGPQFLPKLDAPQRYITLGILLGVILTSTVFSAIEVTPSGLILGFSAASSRTGGAVADMAAEGTTMVPYTGNANTELSASLDDLLPQEGIPVDVNKRDAAIAASDPADAALLQKGVTIYDDKIAEARAQATISATADPNPLDTQGGHPVDVPDSSSRGNASGNHLDVLGSPLSSEVLSTLLDPWKAKVPILEFFMQEGGSVCRGNNYVLRGLQEARKHNDVVYWIGPDACQAKAEELDVILVPLSDYDDVIDWFSTNVGEPVRYQVRWLVLRAFMERHAIPRLFYIDSDVLLFTNITALAHMMFPKAHLALPLRWPSLVPPLGPSQKPAVAVAGHISLWSYEALADFSYFLIEFFKNAVLFGEPGDKGLTKSQPYNDMVVLGWYTFPNCWVTPPGDKCISGRESGTSPERAARIRGKAIPKFEVESLCKPQWCKKSVLADEGWCLFDNNFSVKNGTFRYRPGEGMKLPTSMYFTHFEDYTKQKQTSPVQFFAVHFQGRKKGGMLAKDPGVGWGSASD